MEFTQQPYDLQKQFNLLKVYDVLIHTFKFGSCDTKYNSLKHLIKETNHPSPTN
jgi:hypothetical protein